MIVSPPISVTALVRGVVVLYFGTPRTVLAVERGGPFVSLMLEGIAVPIRCDWSWQMQIVIVDTEAAIETLRAAGLNPEVIDLSAERTIEE